MYSIHEFELDGKTVGLRFGTRAFKYLEGLTNESLGESMTKLSTGKVTFEFICQIIEAAAVDYKVKTKAEVNFTSDDMCDWVDAIGGLEGAMEIIGNGMKQYFPKNSKSLA